MKAVVTVVGKDCVGILAGVSGECAKYGVNIIDVSQTVMGDLFCMIMIGDIDRITIGFAEFSDIIKDFGKKKNLSVHAMHEDIFNSMHKI